MLSVIRKIAVVICAAGLLLGCQDQSREPTEDNLRAALDHVLNGQNVILKSPGFPSKVAEMVLVIEDPKAPENQGKKYHPAEITGWESMLGYARLYEKAGVVSLESGTFDEQNYSGANFRFTGYRVHIGDDLKKDTVVIPTIGKVGLKAGWVAVDRIVKISPVTEKNGLKTVEVTYTRKADNLRTWCSEEILESSGMHEALSGEQKTVLQLSEQGWVVSDPNLATSTKTQIFRHL